LEQVYLWQGDLRSSETPVLETAMESPNGYDTKLVADVRPQAGVGLGLVAVAYGAKVGHCYAAVFKTHAEGNGADAALGRRLRLMVAGTLGRMQAISLEELPQERLGL
jgi:hypothetical protein